MSQYRVSLCVSVPGILDARYRQIARSHGLPLSRVVELAMIHAEEQLVPMLDQITKKPQVQPQTPTAQPTQAAS